MLNNYFRTHWLIAAYFFYFPYTVICKPGGAGLLVPLLTAEGEAQLASEAAAALRAAICTPCTCPRLPLRRTTVPKSSSDLDGWPTCNNDERARRGKSAIRMSDLPFTYVVMQNCSVCVGAVQPAVKMYWQEQRSPLATSALLIGQIDGANGQP